MKDRDQETLPSGQQHNDLMEELHSFLWGTTTAGAVKRMRTSEFEARRAEGARLEIVVGDMGSTGNGTDPPPAVEPTPPPAMNPGRRAVAGPAATGLRRKERKERGRRGALVRMVPTPWRTRGRLCPTITSTATVW